ncbi:hypothetical protein CQW23_04387 [Capsicum baccatum]|uniref:Glutaredoxin domain-containing protein n=1 Tax=Capsicum baccatum TaxID=33114 RepID=A0A2G2XEY4_CAPBA|nr:hypothetical protein CQW23_04387 [Capsicum baccatum]
MRVEALDGVNSGCSDTHKDSTLGVTIAYVENDKRELVQEVHQLARLGMLLVDSAEGNVLVQSGSGEWEGGEGRSHRGSSLSLKRAATATVEDRGGYIGGRAGRSSAALAPGGSSSGGSGTPPGHPSNRTKRKTKTNFVKMIDENAVIIISTSKCCMCIIVKSLLVSLGINPKVFNVDKEEKNFVLMKLSKMNEDANSSTGGRGRTIGVTNRVYRREVLRRC